MTIDERFERIEHVTAGMAEQTKQEREESRQLWRDTQRQLNELTLKLADLAAETRDGDESLRRAIHDFAQESRAANERLKARIGELVVAIGAFIRQEPPANSSR